MGIVRKRILKLPPLSASMVADDAVESEKENDLTPDATSDDDDGPSYYAGEVRPYFIWYGGP